MDGAVLISPAHCQSAKAVAARVVGRIVAAANVAVIRPISWVPAVAALAIFALHSIYVCALLVHVAGVTGNTASMRMSGTDPHMPSELVN